MTLHIRDEETKARRPAWETLVRQRDSVIIRRPARILVVDDELIMRRAYEHLLRAEGHDVQVAEDGSAGLAILQREQFDLVLLDMMMPKLNGLEVLGQLRADARTAELPVLMCSGSDDLDDIVRCIELGADDYLLKPPRAELLHARVRAAIERKFARDQERAYLRWIDRERRRADTLLSSLFPAPVVQELKASGTVASRRHEDVAVLFCDVVRFTEWSEQHPPEAVVQTLQMMVQRFEEVVDEFGLEKIKTVGDSFMATAGLFEPLQNPVLACVRAAEAMIHAVRVLAVGWEIRVGIHVGPVVAGVIGHKQYQFDVWGDTVNTASRIERHGRAGAVVVSARAWERVSSVRRGESLGTFEIKGKGPMELFVVLSEDSKP